MSNLTLFDWQSCHCQFRYPWVIHDEIEVDEEPNGSFYSHNHKIIKYTFAFVQGFGQNSVKNMYSMNITLSISQTKCKVVQKDYLWMKTVDIPSDLAIAHACWPPAPPKQASTCREVSYPFAYKCNKYYIVRNISHRLKFTYNMKQILFNILYI